MIKRFGQNIKMKRVTHRLRWAVTWQS